MTVSYFDALESQMAAIEAERMQQAALAASYPHLTREGARRMWSGWTEQVNRVAREAAVQAGHLFSWNGAPISLQGLKKKLVKQLGRGAEVA